MHNVCICFILTFLSDNYFKSHAINNKMLTVTHVVEEISVISKPEDITLKETSLSATFEWTMSKEGLKVEWLKDGKSLGTEDKITKTVNGNTYKLKLANIDDRDAGTYTLKYQNLESSANLKVEGT